MKIYTYEMTVDGLFGRNRKVKTQSIVLFDNIPVDSPLQISELKSKALDNFSNLKVKPGCKIKIFRYESEIKDGMKITSLAQFSSNNILESWIFQ